MSDNDDIPGGIIGALLILGIILTIVAAVLVLGAVYGGGMAIHNYTKSVKANVALERA